MRSHVRHLLGLRQDFKQVISRKEIEPSKDSALLFKVILEATLYFLEVSIASPEGLKQTNVVLELTRARLEYVRILISALDDLDPELVHGLELL